MNTERLNEIEAAIAALREEEDSLKSHQSELEAEREDFDVSEHFSEEYIAENLNDQNGPVEVLGRGFDASRIIRELDPTAWREMVNDWLDAIDITTVDAYRDIESDLAYIENRLSDIEDEVQALREEADELRSEEAHQ